jgi:orotate phosphoribosyltransferase
MRIEEIRSRLKPIVQECILYGDFALARGDKTDLYVRGRVAALSSQGLWLLAEAVLLMIEGKNVAGIGGMADAADPITGGVLALAGERAKKLAGFSIHEKPKGDGVGKRVEGTALLPNSQVVLLQDVVTSGRLAVQAAEIVKAERALKPLAVITMLDCLEGGAESLAKIGVELWPIFTRKDFELGGQTHFVAEIQF